VPSSSISSSDRAAALYTPATGARIAARARLGAKRGGVALLLRAGALLCIAAVPVAFSAWVDPARLIASRGPEEAIARTLASGKNVAGFASYDDRAIERTLAALRTARPEVLVLGSSRMQPIPASAFPGATFVNASVQLATLDDLIGLYALYDTDGRRPRRLVLGVDPWTQSHHTDPQWAALADERATLMRRAGIAVSPVREYAALELATLKRVAAPEYFRLSVFMLRQHGRRGIEWQATDREHNALKTKRPEGTVIWPDVSPSSAVADAEKYAAEGLAADERFADLGARVRGREDALEQFIRYVRGEGVEVTLVLSPYSPVVYDAFAKLKGTTPMAVETQIRALAARTGVRVAGSYDPRVAGVVATDLFDESHLRPEAMTRVLGTGR